MSTREERTQAALAWREKNQVALLQTYLPRELIARLDAMVQSSGCQGRSDLLGRLIEQATLPATDPQTTQDAPPAAPAAETPGVASPSVPVQAATYRLRRSKGAHGGWDLVQCEVTVAHLRRRTDADGWEGWLHDAAGTPSPVSVSGRTRVEVVARLVPAAGNPQ